MSLTEALSGVGGINELEADATGIFVIRSTLNQQAVNQGEQPINQEQQTSNQGTVANIYQLNIKDASALVIGTEFELQPYDIVYVTAAPISRWNRVVKQLLPTISGFNNLTEGVNRVRVW
ncbi:hypothetical protein [Photobacterium swingsii]